MRKNKRFLGGFLSLCLCSMLLGNMALYPYNVKAVNLNTTEGKISIPFVQTVEKTWSKKLPLKEKCVFYGKKTAQEANEVKDDKTVLKKRVRTILNEYYSTPKSQRKELKNFKEYIDDSADQIVKNYEEAEAERDNQEK